MGKDVTCHFTDDVGLIYSGAKQFKKSLESVLSITNMWSFFHFCAECVTANYTIVTHALVVNFTKNSMRQYILT